MRSAVVAALVLSAGALAPTARAQWTVAHRVTLPRDGSPIDLASLAAPHEDPVRIVLSGSFSCALDGSEIDAFGARTAGANDVAAGPFVILPAGSRVVTSDPLVHRYTVDVPRTESMRVAFAIAPLAMRHLVTASEARASLQGAIELEHLARPAPPPPAAVVLAREASAPAPVGLFLAVALVLLGGAGWAAGRRRDVGLALLRRARRAHRSVARECAALGPAFDEVAASTQRLVEAAVRTDAHRRAAHRALRRTAWTHASDARARLAEQAALALARLEQIVARLERTATELAGRQAASSEATGVDAMLEDLADELDSAVSAHDEAAAS